MSKSRPRGKQNAAASVARSLPSGEPLQVDDAANVKTALAHQLAELGEHVVQPQGSITLPILGDQPPLPSLITAPALEVPGVASAAAAAAPAPAIDEKVYGPAEQANIQGNTIPGFNKDHQHFLFFRIRQVAKCKAWLKWLKPQIASLDEVLAFVRQHRALRLRMGVKEPPLTSCWVNIAFSHAAIGTLAGTAAAEAFGDQSFQQGLAARSTYIGDPSDEKNPANRRHWAFGGPKNEADIMVIVAADEPATLKQSVRAIVDRAERSGLRLLFDQRCDTLPGNLRGHEHFGFKDGISQPGVRGRVSHAPDDYITPRYLDPNDPRSAIFGKPGQLLVWPGQFLLGEPRQSPESMTDIDATPVQNFPDWAKLGSYVVCRRLLQDVPAFWKFTLLAGRALGISADQFAAMLVGRWPSGAPVMRSPQADNPALAADEWANNHFIYDDNTRPSNLIPISGYAGDNFPQAAADVLGTVVPHFSHIRKMNPRDIATDLGKPSDSLVRMLLRRGIPFGKPLVGVKRPAKALLKQERGLMFISYCASIEDQFEFLNRRWANSPMQPSAGGHDPIIGQAEQHGSRERFIDFPTAGGTQRIKIAREWVTPSGGGYFFSPPIAAISDVLGS